MSNMPLTDHEFELYRLAVEGIRENESKRQNAKSIYATVTVGLVTVATASAKPNFLFLAISCSFIAILWWLTIKYHRSLAEAKWYSVKHYQDKLEYSPFDEEWKKYTSEKRNVQLTTIEQFLPIVVFIVSLIYMLYRLICYSVCNCHP